MPPVDRIPLPTVTHFRRMAAWVCGRLHALRAGPGGEFRDIRASEHDTKRSGTSPATIPLRRMRLDRERRSCRIGRRPWVGARRLSDATGPASPFGLHDARRACPGPFRVPAPGDGARGGLGAFGRREGEALGGR